MTADRLRAAASLLRERAEAADEGPWDYDGQAISSHWPGGSVAQTGLYENGEYIATMSPPVALALADWLDATTATLARDTERLINDYDGDVRVDDIAAYEGGWLSSHPALAVADAILGDRS